jgi:hypothetical protein
MWGSIGLDVVDRRVCRWRSVFMTGDMSSRDQEVLSRRVRYRGSSFQRRVVRRTSAFVVALVWCLKRKGGRRHCFSNVILRSALWPSSMPVGSAPFSFRPTIVSWQKLGLTLVALSRPRSGGVYIDVLNRSSNGKSMDCPWPIGRTEA